MQLIWTSTLISPCLLQLLAFPSVKGQLSCLKHSTVAQTQHAKRCIVFNENTTFPKWLCQAESFSHLSKFLNSMRIILTIFIQLVSSWVKYFLGSHFVYVSAVLLSHCLTCFSVLGPSALVPPGASQQSAPYAASHYCYYQSKINERQKTNPATGDWVQHKLQAANTRPKQFTIGKQSGMQKQADIWWTAAVMAHIWLVWEALGHRCALLCGIGMACCELSGGNPFIILIALNPLHRVNRCILMPSRSVPDSSIAFYYAY